MTLVFVSKQKPELALPNDVFIQCRISFQIIYIYSNKKVTSVFYGSVSFDLITLSPQK